MPAPGVCDIAQDLRRGALTAVDVMRDCLTRSAAEEPRVQAWQHLDAARALEAAAAADVLSARGEPTGPLHGVPIAIKDIIDVAGMPTTMGSPIFAGRIASASASCVTRLLRAGALIMGKTVTTEFAYYHPGRTRNPWNVAHTPGGSSSGSAAAVACGMVPAALGTQTNGSVIRPAAYCGVVGFKPALGAVANDGTLDPWPTLDHTGVFARSVADAALVASVIVQDDHPVAATITPLASPHFAAVRTPVWSRAQAAQQERFALYLQTLREAGATITEVELPESFADAHRILRLIMAHEGACFFRALRAQHGEQMSVALKQLLDEGEAIPAAEYRSALDARMRLSAQFSDFIRPHAAVLTPPATGEAPESLVSTGDPAFCTLWSLLGVPAITLPAGLGPQGLPLGLQVVGAGGADDTCLAAAAWCEKHLPFSGWLNPRLAGSAT